MNTTNTNTESDSYLFQLHLAEYSALTNRTTYWITMQFFVWPILIAYFALAAQIWNAQLLPKAIMNWGGVIITEIIVWHWYHAAFEMYKNATYLETKLRSQVQRLVPNQQFWCYENFRHGSVGRQPPWNELWPIPALIIGVGIAMFRTCSTFSESWNLGIVINTFVIAVVVWLLFGIFRQFTNLVEMRREFSAARVQSDDTN